MDWKWKLWDVPVAVALNRRHLQTEVPETSSRGRGTGPCARVPVSVLFNTKAPAVYFLCLRNKPGYEHHAVHCKYHRWQVSMKGKVLLYV